ncbi:hypothetical protein B0189_08480 [Moraxella cuniculi]|nr:hypothetical protein B0189_08480 [Moraxella cuniculi]
MILPTIYHSVMGVLLIAYLDFVALANDLCEFFLIKFRSSKNHKTLPKNVLKFGQCIMLG